MSIKITLQFQVKNTEYTNLKTTPDIERKPVYSLLQWINIIGFGLGL